jgi:uncharacterized protein with GYD domain
VARSPFLRGQKRRGNVGAVGRPQTPLTTGRKRGEDQMATYIVLGHFTEQGIRTVNDTVKRSEAFKELAKTVGATAKDLFWTIGQYDVVAIVDAPNDEAITLLGLKMGKLGNIRTETLRAFSRTEMEGILGKLK